MNGTTDRVASRVYLDSNVFIEAFEGRGRLAELLRKLLLTANVPAGPPLVTSELTAAELLVKPLQLGRHDLVQICDNWTISNPYLEVVPVVRGVLKDAAELRARDRGLKLPDAIHMTTAIGTRCRYFLTNDKRIKGQFGVEILDLSEANMEMLLETPSR